MPNAREGFDEIIAKLNPRVRRVFRAQLRALRADDSAREEWQSLKWDTPIRRRAAVARRWVRCRRRLLRIQGVTLLLLDKLGMRPL